jgi:hypothetical protein
MKLQDKGQVQRGWGYEIVWANNDKYSGKLLVFERAGAKTSMVLHKERAKTWFVNGGKFKFKFIDVQTGELKEAILEEGQTVDLGELGPHQLESLVDNSIILEVGTPDYVEDRIRLSPGDSQTQTSSS